MPEPDVGGGTYAQAVKAIRNRDFCQSRRFVDQQMRADRVGAHPEILGFERLLVKRLRGMGIPMFAHCVWRGEAEQTRLYVQGRSKAAYGDSAHNYGCAVDLVHGTLAWNMTERSWAVIAHVGKELAASKGWKLEWGGSWKFYDPAHWQLADWRERAAQAGIALR